MKRTSLAGLAALVTALAAAGLPIVAAPAATRVAAFTIAAWLGQIPVIWYRVFHLLG